MTNLTPEQESDDGLKRYGVAIRPLRLRGIRRGEFKPNPDDPKEMAAARLARVVE